MYLPQQCRTEDGYLVRQSLMKDVPYGFFNAAKVNNSFNAEAINDCKVLFIGSSHNSCTQSNAVFCYSAVAGISAEVAAVDNIFTCIISLHKRPSRIK